MTSTGSPDGGSVAVRVRRVGAAPRIDLPTFARLTGGVAHLTLQDLRHRARRFAVALFGTAMVLTLLLLITGLSTQFRREALQTTQALGASHWVVPDGVRGPFTTSNRLEPQQVTELVAAGGSPVVLGRLQAEHAGVSSDLHFVGHAGDLGAPDVVDGRPASAPGEAIISEDASIPIGGVLDLGPVEVEVVGIVAGATLLAGVPVTFVPLEHLAGLVPDRDAAVSAVLFDAPPAASVVATDVFEMEEIARATQEPLDSAIQTIDLLRVLLSIVAVMIISTVTYLSTIDRQKDIAVLRAMGTGPTALAATVALQAVVLAVVAAALAIGLQALVAPIFPMRVFLRTSDFLLLPVYAMVIALLASYGAIRRTLRIDPATAFGGPGA